MTAGDDGVVLGQPRNLKEKAEKEVCNEWCEKSKMAARTDNPPCAFIHLAHTHIRYSFTLRASSRSWS